MLYNQPGDKRVKGRVDAVDNKGVWDVFEVMARGVVWFDDDGVYGGLQLGVVKLDSLRLKKPKISKRKHSTVHSKRKDTLRFYRKQLGFKKPSTVLLGGPVLYFITDNKLSTKDIQEVLQDDEAKFLTTNCALRELEVFYQKFQRSAKMLETIKLAQTLDVAPCMHKSEINAEECLRSVVGIKNPRKMFVAVVANWPLKQKDPTVPIIIADNCSFCLKQLSSSEQRLAKKMNRDLDISPSFERLQSRIKFFGCVGKIAVDEGGNGQFKVISELLRPLEVPYEKVREDVVIQLRSYPKLYQNFVDLDGPEADVHLAYSEYVNSMSRDGAWGDECTLQAAADFFQVMFVVITSLEGVLVKEFRPYGMEEDEYPEKGLFLSCLYENDEKHYNILHRTSYHC
ncbi:OTU domain-containing protein [Tanacetum coccineum]